MLYLYKVVLGVTGAEGSSEEQVESFGGLLSPKQLVVLLGVHVQLPLETSMSQILETVKRLLAFFTHLL